MILNPFKSIIEDVRNASIEISGNSKMTVTDCKCVVDYSNEFVVLNIGELNVKIKGDGLVLSSFTYGETNITGEIVSVEFERCSAR